MNESWLEVTPTKTMQYCIRLFAKKMWERHLAAIKIGRDSLAGARLRPIELRRDTQRPRLTVRMQAPALLPPLPS